MADRFIRARAIAATILNKLDEEYLFGWEEDTASLEENEAWQRLKKHEPDIACIVFEELEGRPPTDAERKALAS